MRGRAALRFALGATAIPALLVLASWLANDRDLAWFLHAGNASPALEEIRRVYGDDVAVPLEDGHDGTTFWALARDPLLRDDGTEAQLDRPAYRARRIGYPLLVAPWRAFGDQGLLVGMVVVNLAAVFAGTLLTLRLAERFGSRRRSALAFALSPAVLVAVLFDLSDALALAFLLLAVVGALERRLAWIVVGAVAAVLTRELMILGLAGLALLAPDVRPRDRVVAVGAGAASLVAWGGYVATRLPEGVGPSGGISRVPFAGWFDAWEIRWGNGDLENALLSGLVLLAGVAVVVLFLRRRDALLAVALPFALLLPFLDANVLTLPLNMVRAVTPMLTLLPLAADKLPVKEPTP